MPVPVSDLQAIAPSSIIELFELQLNTTQHGVNDIYRFHAGTSLNSNGELVWAGNSYMRFPIQADGFEYTGNGQLPRPKIRCSNIMGTITSLLLTLPDGLEGAKVTRIRTLARYIDAVNFPGNVNPYGTPDPTAAFPSEIYYVDRKTAETRDAVEFELAAAFDLAGIRAPKRQCISNICQWVYRSTECSYTGAAYYDANDSAVTTLAADVCGKRLSSCEARFKSFTKTGSVVSGSTQLTLTNPINIDAGTPVAGFGLPSGTTVSSVASGGLLVTVNQAATATTTVTTTGTIQSNKTQLIVSSATGLAQGMTVTGPNIPAGTTITGISGTTLTLSQSAATVYTLFATRSGRIYQTSAFPVRVFSTSNQLQVTTSGLAAGMLVLGAGLPSDYTVSISSVSSGYVTLSYTANTSSSYSNYSFYTTAAYSAQTYTFSANTTYTFRDPANDALPFGSFPGVGTYFS